MVYSLTKEVSSPQISKFLEASSTSRRRCVGGSSEGFRCGIRDLYGLPKAIRINVHGGADSNGFRITLS